MPSVIYYDYQNTPKLCGAQTEDVVCSIRLLIAFEHFISNFFTKDALMTAEDKNWMKAEW